jgi:ABC-type lipoprotein release transport system permease subunit
VSFTLARIVYGVAEATIHLGMTMGLREMVVALVASIIMTTVSSVFAIRRLWKVDPIMLFE